MELVGGRAAQLGGGLGHGLGDRLPDLLLGGAAGDLRHLPPRERAVTPAEPVRDDVVPAHIVPADQPAALLVLDRALTPAADPGLVVEVDGPPDLDLQRSAELEEVLVVVAGGVGELLRERLEDLVFVVSTRDRLEGVREEGEEQDMDLAAAFLWPTESWMAKQRSRKRQGSSRSAFRSGCRVPASRSTRSTRIWNCAQR
ncbi:hypothetical protein SMICM304S_04248 [Streptomyces microflavus]